MYTRVRSRCQHVYPGRVQVHGVQLHGRVRGRRVRLLERRLYQQGVRL